MTVCVCDCLACDHVFCVPCLRVWRQGIKRQQHTLPPPDTQDFPLQPRRARAAMSHTCPLCRRVNHYVLPSRDFMTGDTKQAYLRAYRVTMSQQPCRYYKATRPLSSCPFFYQCFYAHVDPTTGQDVKRKQAMDQTFAYCTNGVAQSRVNFLAKETLHRTLWTRTRQARQFHPNEYDYASWIFVQLFQIGRLDNCT